jgi:hypothetical protein
VIVPFFKKVKAVAIRASSAFGRCSLRRGAHCRCVGCGSALAAWWTRVLFGPALSFPSVWPCGVWGLTDRFLDSWWSFLSIPADPLSPLAGLAGCGGFALQSGRSSLFVGNSQRVAAEATPNGVGRARIQVGLGNSGCGGAIQGDGGGGAIPGDGGGCALHCFFANLDLASSPPLIMAPMYVRLSPP